MNTILGLSDLPYQPHFELIARKILDRVTHQIRKFNHLHSTEWAVVGNSEKPHHPIGLAWKPTAKHGMVVYAIKSEETPITRYSLITVTMNYGVYPAKIHSAFYDNVIQDTQQMFKDGLPDDYIEIIQKGMK
jgi:hypothetical protein